MIDVLFFFYLPFPIFICFCPKGNIYPVQLMRLFCLLLLLYYIELFPLLIFSSTHLSFFYFLICNLVFIFSFNGFGTLLQIVLDDLTLETFFCLQRENEFSPELNLIISVLLASWFRGKCFISRYKDMKICP